ncbi:unnamed protein product [Penicillium salamii]|uniref:tRNA (uracil-O(2)-)-methyltransferase n=1 Tax=Penicillium salamii TaxID=1612424 RepID=A0A9W4NZL4_9EURO|nr:unnamed protein product [Penicillium salamii]
MERRFTSRNVCLDWIKKETKSEIPAFSIQNTYERLRFTYEKDLRQSWAEQLESPNQILEQLSVAACLIELWKIMYKTDTQSVPTLPKFVDIACGNGILVYVLCMEGYECSGYDACHRRSWDTFPPEIQSCLHEKVIIPKPFLDVLDTQEIEIDLGIGVESGLFPDTFIISDHADELTVWTPILAALACPLSPLSFLVTPCCSRSLAGSSLRYPPVNAQAIGPHGTDLYGDGPCKGQPQPCSGDLRALRAAKMKEKTESGFLDSMIGSLVAKTASVAGEMSCGVEKAWLRTPGAVNLALIGRWETAASCLGSGDSVAGDLVAARLKIMEVVERECLRDGGIQAAARLWVERVKTLRCANGTQHRSH